MMPIEPKMPTFDKLMNPLLLALVALGGSGSVEEIYNKVVELERFSDDVLSQLHDPEDSNNSEIWYRLAWARTYLKKYGLLENSKRGVWALTAKARALDKVDPQDVVRTVKTLDRKDAAAKPADQPAPNVPEEEAWKQSLHAVLTQKLSPAGFEKLV